MRKERFVLLARRLGRYLSFAANGSGRSGGWGRLVGQMYRIWWQLSVVLYVDVKEATVCMLVMIVVLEIL